MNTSTALLVVPSRPTARSSSPHRPDPTLAVKPPSLCSACSIDEPLLRDLLLSLDLHSVLEASLEVLVPCDVTEPCAPPPPPPREAVHLPLEVVDTIVEFSQAEGDAPQELRRLALVNRIWARSARRILYLSIQSLLSTGALLRLRDVFASSPELTRHVRKVDLSNPNCRWESSQVSEFFRRASGLLRETPLVKEISVLHIALSDSVRRKLFGALATLPITSASFDASCWSTNNHRPVIQGAGSPDVVALTLTLCRWTHLKTLCLHGYNESPRIISVDSLPCHTFPSYELETLEIGSSELSGTSLLWLVGNSCKTLRQLNLSNVTGLTLAQLEDVLSLVGPSLVELQITLDQDDFVSTNSTHPFLAKGFSALTSLETLVVSTDLDTKALLSQLAHLPRLAFLGLNCPTLPYSRLEAFLKKNLAPLKDLNLDLWGEGEDETWTSHTRFLAARVCRRKGIELLIDGSDIEEIEDQWFGVGAGGMDLGRCWDGLEGMEWPLRAPLALREPERVRSSFAFTV